MVKIKNFETLDSILNKKIEGLTSFKPKVYRLAIESKLAKVSEKDLVLLLAIEKQLLSVYEDYRDSKVDKISEKAKKNEVVQWLIDLKQALQIVSDDFFNLKQVLLYDINILLDTRGYISKPKLLKFLRLLIILIDYEVAQYVWRVNNG